MLPLESDGCPFKAHLELMALSESGDLRQTEHRYKVREPPMSCHEHESRATLLKDQGTC
jgi:hypothetical protein